MNLRKYVGNRRVVVSMLVALLLPLLSVGSVFAETGETLWLDTYEFQSEPGGGDGNAGPVFTSSVLGEGISYKITVQGTYSIWWPDERAWGAGYIGTPGSAPMFPSPSTANGKVGLDAEWIFAIPNGFSGGDRGIPATWNMVEFTSDGGQSWTHITADNAGSAPNSDHKYVYSVTGKGKKFGVRLNDWFTMDNYGMLKVTVEPPYVQVGIDVKPGSATNPINLGSKGDLPVAVLGSASFDAAAVVPASVTLNGAQVALAGNGRPNASLEDVNGDGRKDLVLHFDVQLLKLTAGDTVVVLSGKTQDGRTIRGTDAVRIVP